MEKELKAVKVSVNGILTSQRSGASASEIESLYKILLGVELPYRKFNCRNAEDFIVKFMSDVAQTRGSDGHRVFTPIINEETKHVAILVSRTKETKKISGKPKRVVTHNYKTAHHAKKQSRSPPWKVQRPVNAFSTNSSNQERHAFCTNGPARIQRKSEGSNYGFSHNIPNSSNTRRNIKQQEPSGRPPNKFHPQACDNPRAMGAGEGHYNQEPWCNNSRKFQYSSSSDDDAFHRRASVDNRDMEGRKPMSHRQVVIVDNPRLRSARDEPSFHTDFQSGERYRNFKISVPAKPESRERTVSFPDSPEKLAMTNEFQVKRSIQSLSTANDARLNSPPNFERSVSLNDPTQSDKRMTGFHRGISVADVSNSYATLWISDKSANVQSTIGPCNSYSPKAVKASDGLYSPMNTPVTSSFYSGVTDEISSQFSNCFVMPKSPAVSSQVSKKYNNNNNNSSELECRISQNNCSAPYLESALPKVTSSLSTSYFLPNQPPSTSTRPVIYEDPSIIPPVTTPSFTPSKIINQISSTIKTLSSPTSPASAKFSDVRIIQTPIAPSSNSPHQIINTSPDQSQMRNDEENQMILVTEVHSTSLVLGHFNISEKPITFALTNLEDLTEVDLDYVRILLLNRYFKAAFDYNSSKCYGTLYKKNGPAWINMNLFILEETLDPISVKKNPQSYPTYTVSELFSIRKKSRCLENRQLLRGIQEREVVSGIQPARVDNVERKLGIVHSWENNGKIILDFFSLDEAAEIKIAKTAKPYRQIVDGRTRVSCYLKGYSGDEVEWTPTRLSKMREVLKVGSKVLVKIFERSYCCDPHTFCIDLRSLGQCSFLTDVLRRESSLCPPWKVAQVEMPSSGDRIFVTHVRSLQHIYALPFKYLKSFEEMFLALQDFFGKVDSVGLNAGVHLQCLCGFQSSEDDLWYRGRIEAVKENNKVLVYSVDFGTYETLPDTSILDLPNSFRNLPLLSCYLKLSGTMISNGTKHDLEEKVLHKIFRYFPLKPKTQDSPGVLLNPCKDSPLVL